MGANNCGLGTTGLVQRLIEHLEKLRLRKAKLKPKDGEYLAEVGAEATSGPPPPCDVPCCTENSGKVGETCLHLEAVQVIAGSQSVRDDSDVNSLLAPIFIPLGSV